MLLAVRAGAAPAGGMLSARLDSSSASSLQTLADLVRHLALPAVALAVGLTPVLAGHVRSSLADTLHAPFIVAATSRGVPGRRVLFRSALRAAAAPLMALFGLSVASLFSASLLVEVITGWPGLGPLLVEATRSRDVPVVIGVTLCSVLLLAAGNLVTDIGMRLADPRARARTGPVTER
jgi:peptide/nickel transport system permease protein